MDEQDKKDMLLEVEEYAKELEESFVEADEDDSEEIRNSLANSWVAGFRHAKSKFADRIFYNMKDAVEFMAKNKNKTIIVDEARNAWVDKSQGNPELELNDVLRGNGE